MPAVRALDERDRALLDALDHEAQAHDGLTRSLSWTVSEVAARLLSLELDGWVHQDRDGRFRRRRTEAEAEVEVESQATPPADEEPPTRV